MENRLAASSGESRFEMKKLWPWLLVFLILYTVGCIRVRLLDMPLERDEGEYAYAGQLLLQGVPPYELAYNMKLPGTYFAFAVGMAIFGKTTVGVHLMLLAANSLTAIFVFLLGRRLFGLLAGLVACGAYAVLSMSPAVLGLAAHATQFVMLCAVPATLLLWMFHESERTGVLFCSALLYCLAFLMKQPGIVFGVFGGLFLLGHGGVSRRPAQWFATTGLVYGLGLLLPFALTCAAMAWAGNFGRFWFWTFTYAQSYGTTPTLAYGLMMFRSYFSDYLAVYFPFFIVTAMGLAFVLRNAALRTGILFSLGFFVFGLIGTSMGFYFRQHYFILLLPAFAVLTGLSVRSLQEQCASKSARIVLVAAFIAVLGWPLLYSRGVFFRKPPDQVVEALYSGNPFNEAVPVAAYIREHSAPDARVAVIGSEPEIYFYSQRHSATGYIYTYPLTEHQANAGKMTADMMREVEAARPEFMVWIEYPFSWLVKRPDQLPLFTWFNDYVGKYCELVGVASRSPSGKNFYLWDNEARAYDGSLGNCILVFKRKAVQAAPPGPGHP